MDSKAPTQALIRRVYNFTAHLLNMGVYIGGGGV